MAFRPGLTAAHVLLAVGRQAAFYAESLESFRAEADRASLAVLFLRGEMPGLLRGACLFLRTKRLTDSIVCD